MYTTWSSRFPIRSIPRPITGTVTITPIIITVRCAYKRGLRVNKKEEEEEEEEKKEYI